MKRIDMRIWSVLAVAALLCLAVQATGEEQLPVKVTIYPAAEPSPALRYQLLPDFARRVNGNAAVYYGKVTAEQIPFFSNEELAEKIEKWRAAPLEDLPSPMWICRSARSSITWIGRRGASTPTGSCRLGMSRSSKSCSRTCSRLDSSRDPSRQGSHPHRPWRVRPGA